MREMHWHPNADEWQYSMSGSGRGNDDLVFLEMFASSYYSAISFSQWVRHSPPDLVKAHFNFSDDTLNAIPRGKTNVIGSLA